jgi:hypothetical protein
MKKLLLKTAVVALAVATMSACGSKSNDFEVVTEETETVTGVSDEVSSEETSEETSVDTTETESETATETQTEVQAETTTVEVKTTVETKSQPTSAAKKETETKKADEPALGALGVTYKGKKIMLNSNMGNVSSSLGSTTDYSEAPSCNYNGLDKVFVYGDVSVYTYPNANGDYINEIEVDDNSVATESGLLPIGKTINDVKAVYGEPTSVEGSTYKYANGNCYTYFYADGENVLYWGVAVEQ